MCVFHSSQFTFMTRNQAAQPPNIIVDTKSGGNSAPLQVSSALLGRSADLDRRSFQESGRLSLSAEIVIVGECGRYRPLFVRQPLVLRPEMTIPSDLRFHSQALSVNVGNPCEFPSQKPFRASATTLEFCVPSALLAKRQRSANLRISTSTSRDRTRLLPTELRDSTTGNSLVNKKRNKKRKNLFA